MEKTYWNNNGKHQELYKKLWKKLVPASGAATTRAGELLRASSRLYYRWFNDGDRIERCLLQSAAESSAMNAWGFIFAFEDPKTGFSGEPLAWKILDATSEKEYEKALEEMADAVIEYVASAPEEPNDTDFTEKEYCEVFEFDIESEDYEN